MKRKDIIGQRFGKLKVVSFAYTRKGNGRSYHSYYNCICDCGKSCVIDGLKLRSGHTQSCGCYRHERQIEANTKHKGRYTRLYIVWCNMKGRCYNPNNKRYANYGARGITVCEEWRENFGAFKEWAEKNGYKVDAKRGENTIDRINNDKDYCPENCRWVSNKQQANNKSTNIFITYKSRTKTIAEWSEEIGLKPDTIKNRIKKGWSIEKTFETKARGK